MMRNNRAGRQAISKAKVKRQKGKDFDAQLLTVRFSLKTFVCALFV